MYQKKLKVSVFLILISMFSIFFFVEERSGIYTQIGENRFELGIGIDLASSNKILYRQAFTSNDFISNQNTTITSVTSSNSSQISLPLEENGIYNFSIIWGDGKSDRITSWDDTAKTHTYESEGIYTLIINGTLNGFGFRGTGDKLKIQEISQWGNISLGNSAGYFYGCENLLLTATDSLDLTETTTLKDAFRYCTRLGSVADISNWNVSNVLDMSGMFWGAENFNLNISSWDVSEVTDFNRMFFSAYEFNQDISNWNVSSATNMEHFFAHARVFNQNISSWDVSKVNDMSGMFYYASDFNYSLSSWDVSNVEDMLLMFRGASDFNQDISSWDVSKVTDMFQMFSGASSFDQDISRWNVSMVTDMTSMFTWVGLSVKYYDLMLIRWSQLPLQTGVTFDGNYLTYSSAAVNARQYIIDTYEWTITDAGFFDEPIPELNNPLDVNYTEGELNQYIEWLVDDTNPAYYFVTINEVEWVPKTSWSNGTISVDITGLLLGNYTFKIYVYDQKGTHNSDSVNVLVLGSDKQSPDLNSPADISYQLGDGEKYIEWLVGDTNPDYYYLKLNGLTWITNTTWTNGTISINVTGLLTGNYTFTIFVYDTYGNQASDSVNVNVKELIETSITDTLSTAISLTDTTTETITTMFPFSDTTSSESSRTSNLGITPSFELLLSLFSILSIIYFLKTRKINNQTYPSKIIDRVLQILFFLFFIFSFVDFCLFLLLSNISSLFLLEFSLFQLSTNFR